MTRLVDLVGLARGLRRRLPLRLAELGAIVVALGAGYLVTSHLDVAEGEAKPFVRSVQVGQTAHLAYADVRVLDVRAAHTLVPGFGSPVTPAGVFLLVEVRLTATEEPVVFTSSWLVDDRGRKFLFSDKSTCNPAPRALTGVATYALLCFEVPGDLLDEFHLRIARGVESQDENRNGDVADIDLGISPTGARAIAATTASYHVPETSLLPLRLRPAKAGATAEAS